MDDVDPVVDVDSSATGSKTAGRNARIGYVLFGVYSAAYVVFILLNAFRPDLMELTPWAGLNLAVLFGFGLIIGAFLVAILYGWLCRIPVPETPIEVNRP